MTPDDKKWFRIESHREFLWIQAYIQGMKSSIELVKLGVEFDPTSITTPAHYADNAVDEFDKRIQDGRLRTILTKKEG